MEIFCGKCKKKFRTYPSRIGKKNYCSKECAIKDNYGFKPKQKKCCICGVVFIIKTGIRIQKKTCSYECSKKLMYQNSKKQAERLKSTDKNYRCKECKKLFLATAWFKRFYCSKKCQIKHFSEKRIGRGNPAYRNGRSTQENDKRRKLYSSKHLRACAKYRKWFLSKNDFPFCEICKVNKNGTLKFEVHHIYYASKFPKHPELHNFRNLIHICIQCHNDLHAGKKKDVFSRLREHRKLYELFGT